MTPTTTCASRWFATIAQHYGTLDQFHDQRTIRIMLQGVIASAHYYDETTQLLGRDHLEFQADWVRDTAPERHLLHIQQHALEQRLARF